MNIILTHYLHYLGFALLFAALSVELALYKPRVDGATARKLAHIDGLYGGAALLVLVTGLLKVFLYDKPAAYYGHNFIFHIKLTVFVLVFLMSIYPTIHFVKARRTKLNDTATYPGPVRWLLRTEMALLLIIPLLGVMMAQGFGYTG